MPGFIDNHHFGDVTTLMLARGFALFGSVQLSTDEGYRHHVEAPNARDTRLFFHIPNRALIVVLCYDEDDFLSLHDKTRKGVSGNWTVSVRYQYMDERELCRLTYIPFEQQKGGRFGDLDESYRKIMFRGLTPRPKHFTWRGNGEMCELYVPPTPTAPAVVVEDVWLLVEQMLPYLGPLPFDELQVTSFPPHYTFPGCEAVFWEKFKSSVSRTYLWSLVRKPWGCDGLKR